MKTEEVQRQPRRQAAHALSRALQELAPLSCRVVDSRGQEVPLSLAGYVLRFGHSYRLQIIPPQPEEELREARIINPPGFLSQDPEIRDVDQQGRAVHSVPFKVQFDWLAHLKKLGMDVRWDDLEVACYGRPGSTRETVVYSCPVVVRPRWMPALAGVLFGLLLSLAEHVFRASLLGERPVREAFVGFLNSFRFRPETWLLFVGLAAGAWLVTVLICWFWLHLRSRELRGQFRKTYPA